MSQEYALAIYSLALEGWQKDLQAVEEKLAKSPDLLEKLNDTEQPFAERQEQLDKALPKRLSKPMQNFLYTLLKNGHLAILGDVATNLTRLATQGPGVQIAIVTAAIPLSDEEKEQFQTKLSAQYGENVVVDFVVDEAIIGGVIIQVGDKIIDGSMASKLNVAQERLSAV